MFFVAHMGILTENLDFCLRAIAVIGLSEVGTGFFDRIELIKAK